MAREASWASAQLSPLKHWKTAATSTFLSQGRKFTVWMFERVKPNFNITLKKHFVCIYTMRGFFLFYTSQEDMLIESVCRPTPGSDED